MNARKPRPAGPADEPQDLDDADRYRAPALDKGLDILELLSERKDGLTRTEITKELGRNASEIYRMLERLVARQYVIRSPGGDRYSLSLKLYALAHRHPPMHRLIAEALPPMQRFADAAEQSCHLSVYDRGNLLVIAQVDGPGIWGMSVKLGSRVGLVDTASGHAMLAFQSAEQRAHMLAEHTKVKGEQPLAARNLDARLDAIRAAGHVQQDSRQMFGVTDVTHPILGPAGHAIAVLTCPYIRRIDAYVAPPLDAVVALLHDTAADLSMVGEAAV
ncbi:IclR family transcriptional regulator [Burkholderia thailandensis]|uniref:IclR family transcriptional regulator n=1 Tax=Burkholderia thailandensis TaxID=57975 RepID=UPI00016A30B4|nr:IclR family transcriptional regulator [Burkholderia thailandensis]AIP65309.1 IclR family transcriptional regulator [Burkholderia thailandensis]AOI56018.1 IclR family transcriptional regulator [Burkholderia thailandensis]